METQLGPARFRVVSALGRFGWVVSANLGVGRFGLGSGSFRPWVISAQFQ